MPFETAKTGRNGRLLRDQLRDRTKNENHHALIKAPNPKAPLAANLEPSPPATSSSPGLMQRCYFGAKSLAVFTTVTAHLVCTSFHRIPATFGSALTTSDAAMFKTAQTSS